jgi:ribosomal silencing factor RsfS
MADDPGFVAFVGKLKALTTEEKVAAMDYVAVTSVMTTGQLSKMCDAVFRKYTERGFTLTQPEDKQ